MPVLADLTMTEHLRPSVLVKPSLTPLHLGSCTRYEIMRIIHLQRPIKEVCGGFQQRCGAVGQKQVPGRDVAGGKAVSLQKRQVAGRKYIPTLFLNGKGNTAFDETLRLALWHKFLRTGK